MKLRIAALIVVLAGTVRADTIPFPWAGTTFEVTKPLQIQYTYDELTELGELSVSSIAGRYPSKVTLGDQLPVAAQFLLTAVIDPASEQAISASISLKGMFQPSTWSTIWNSSDLVGFGFSSDFREIDFLFVQDGPSVFPGVADGSQFGVMILSDGRWTSTPNWTADFSSAAGANVKNDSGPVVPLPSAVWAGAALLGTMLSVRLRRMRYATRL